MMEMNYNENATFESEIRFLKGQLSALGYDHDFSVDSLPLLGNLVTDLLQTTDSLKHYKKLATGCLQACNDLETFVDAYKKDNAWLIRELNALHLNTISERVAYEKRISDLENRLKCNKQTAVEDLTSVSKNRTRLCQKTSVATDNLSRHGNKNLKEQCNLYEDMIRNKDKELHYLYEEILRLNNLLSEGRPLETIFNHTTSENEVEFLSMKKKNTKLRQHLNEAMIGQHEAKFNALKLAEYFQERECNISGDSSHTFCDLKQKEKKMEVNQEKLKRIEEELDHLKTKYRKLETDAKHTGTKMVDSSVADEVNQLQERTKNLENDKIKLESELRDAKYANEVVISTKEKLETELLETNRKMQTIEVEKSEKEKLFKKYVDDNKVAQNRLQELSIIERDLSIEITRLCSINAVYKRHILELEHRLLETYQNKALTNLQSKSGLLVMKKPLEKKPIRTKTGTTNTSNKENETSNRPESLDIVSEIRSKYRQQIDSIQKGQNFYGCDSSFSSKSRNISFVDEIRQLNCKIDSLKNNLADKEQTVSKLVSNNEELKMALNKSNSLNHVKTHDCEYCKLNERLINDYKEKLLRLEMEKKESLRIQVDLQRTVDCNKQHMVELRTELHGLQMQLQQHRTDSNRLSRLEEDNEVSAESSKILQKQLEIQLESARTRLNLMDKETSASKSENLRLRDTNLKLQKTISDLESHKEIILAMVEEKEEKMNSTEKRLKAKESKIINLEKVINDLKKQLNSSTYSKKDTLSVEQMRIQLKNLENGKQDALNENKKLKKDINSLTEDYLKCKNELERAKKQIRDLNAQMHDCSNKIRAADETLQQKDKERIEMLEYFRTLTVDANEAQSTKTLLRNTESKVVDLEQTVRNKDASITGYLEQIDILTKNVARLENQISNLSDQRDRLQAELDSCELLDSASNNRKYDDTSPEMRSGGKKLNEELQRLRSENEHLRKLYSDKGNISNAVWANSPHRMEQNAIADLQDEIRGLKANIKCLKEALESTSNQLRSTQSEASEYKMLTSQLKVELRNLRFENIRSGNDYSIRFGL